MKIELDFPVFKTNELLSIGWEYINSHIVIIFGLFSAFIIITYFIKVSHHRKKYLKSIRLNKCEYLLLNKNMNIYKDKFTYTQYEGMRVFKNRDQPEKLKYVASTIIYYPETLKKN